jgi:hypothetical protein
VVGGYMDNAEPDLGDGPPELTEGRTGSQVGLEPLSLWLTKPGNDSPTIRSPSKDSHFPVALSD